MWNISIFASGSGTNAENIFNYFTNSNLVNVNLVITDNPKAYVIQRCKKFSVDCKILSPSEIANSDIMNKIFDEYNTNFIVLSGYIRLVPKFIVDKFEGKIVNIHPSLLPKHGGKGMYGHHVHQSVLDSGDNESGITIHFVDNFYDNGSIIFQAKCPVLENDTPDTLAERVHALEYKFYPQIIEKTISKLLS
ncbi:MAG: phosphoribosylglycinamide formyltransferase [Bacteroidales bacterium]|nr:phosphoribosylglycinamide formyltransferase [Bacteroidales bacterium]